MESRHITGCKLHCFWLPLINHNCLWQVSASAGFAAPASKQNHLCPNGLWTLRLFGFQWNGRNSLWPVLDLLDLLRLQADPIICTTTVCQLYHFWLPWDSHNCLWPLSASDGLAAMATRHFQFCRNGLRTIALEASAKLPQQMGSINAFGFRQNCHNLLWTASPWPLRVRSYRMQRLLPKSQQRL